MDENVKCYEFKQMTYPAGILDAVVDATYIIHLEDNGRYTDIQEQLAQYQPSKLVYIVLNKGYKKCDKPKITKPADDLTDAFLQSFKHADRHGYRNILILEDDFIFDKEIKNQMHIQNIIAFLRTHENEPFIYLLGCVPFMQIPYSYTHYIPVSCGSHACIYNKQIRKYILSIPVDDITDWDVCSNIYARRYTYYIPLCYQLIPVTENSLTWGDKNAFTYIGGRILSYIFYVLNMGTSIEPGYSVFYMFSKLLFFILLVLISIIGLRGFRYIMQVRKKRGK